MLKNSINLWIILLTSAQLLGCAHMGVAKLNTKEKIDQLIADQKFSAAEEKLIKMDADDPFYSGRDKKLKQLKSVIWDFERSIIRRAVTNEHKQLWIEADRTFVEGLNKLPDSQIILAARKQFQVRREIRKQVLKAELLVNEGERLLKDARAYQQMLKMNPKNLKIKFDNAVYEGKKAKVSSDLFRYGELASKRKDFFLARRFLNVANKLDSSPEIQKSLLAVNKQINRSRPRNTAVADVTNDKLKVFKRLVSKYKKSLDAGELLAAQKQMLHLKKHYSGKQEVSALSAELNAIVNAKVTVASELGREFYSQGKVQKALNIWKKALPLDPDNVDLKFKILRAEKVLENIRILNKKQQSG